MDMLRTSCVIGAIIFALPMPQGGAASYSALMSKATAQFSDLASFCTANQGVCDTASNILASLEAKATYSAAFISAWADEATGRSADVMAGLEAYVDQIHTGSFSIIGEAPLRGPLFPDN